MTCGIASCWPAVLPEAEPLAEFIGLVILVGLVWLVVSEIVRWLRGPRR